MRLHYSDTHEHVQVGDETVTPDGLSIKIIAIYEHSGAILIEVLSGGAIFSVYRRGATADEIGADWRGGTLRERDTEKFFGKLPANEFYTATPTGRLHDPKPEIQGLPLRTLRNHPVQGAGADVTALELRVASVSWSIIPIDEKDRQRLLDGLAALKRQLPLGGDYAHKATAIENLAERLGKV